MSTIVATISEQSTRNTSPQLGARNAPVEIINLARCVLPLLSLCMRQLQLKCGWARGQNTAKYMIHKINIENEPIPEDNHIPFLEAVETMFDPMNEIIRESMQSILQEQLDRRVEYGS